MLLALLLSGSGPTHAKVKLCVSFHGPGLKHQPGYERLLRSELAHHPTHRVVTRGCQAFLRVEYIQLDTGSFLTAQLHGAVPHRVRVHKKADLPARLREAVAYVLRREPVHLVENLASSGLLNPPRLSLLRHGVYLFGVELAELLWWSAKNIAAVPSAALRFRRTIHRWFLGARVSIAYNPQRRPDVPEKHFLRYHGTARVEVGWCLFPKSGVSLNLSALVGLEYLQVYGLVAGQRKDNILALFGVGLRAEVELLRLYAVRLNLFAQLNLPLHKSHNIDLPVIDAWTPSLAVGVGVAF